MSSISKRIEYSLRPNKAIPLDSRVHFETLKDACDALISNTPISSEDAELVSNRDKLYYYGQLVTTGQSEVYQICKSGESNIFTAELMLAEIKSYIHVYYFRSYSQLKIDASQYTKSYTADFTGTQDYDLLELGIIYTDQIPSHISLTKLIVTCTAVTYTVDTDMSTDCDTTYLKTITSTGGSSQSSGVQDVLVDGTSVVTNKIASISLDDKIPTAGSGLTIDTSTTKPTILLSFSTQGGLSINDSNQLTLNVGAGVQITDNKITLKIDNSSGLELSSNDELKINIKGHVTGDANTDTSTLIDDSYLYYKVGE